ncbi:hypothetical protein NQ317_003108 [Molorchus minor]|uniref:Uncharacterized protein n=1 Tax=Molorchus minor TaxID=1323400 RepID=A0ABQ9JHR5_9CUCU|nr:hypothetical protein NQ317_003108 [Molorchus minor]
MVFGPIQRTEIGAVVGGVNRIWRHNFKVTDDDSRPDLSLQAKIVCRICVNCQINVLTFDLFANCFKSSLSKQTNDCLTYTK